MDALHVDANLVVHEIGGTATANPVGWDEFLASRNDPARLFFIQALSGNSDQLRLRLQAIEADPLILERCADPDTSSGVFSYQRMFVLQLPVARNWASSQHMKMTVICLENAVIVLSEEYLFAGGGFLPSEFWLPVCRQTDMAGMLLVLLDGLIDHSSDLTLQARRAVDQLENDLVGKGGDFGQRLLDYKRSVAHFEMALEAKHRTLTALLSADASPIDLAKIREPLRDVIAHIEHSQLYVERIEDRLSELHHHVTLMLQERTNQRLRVLTILSAIFMPLTFVAGVYGMNFRDMPELGWRYAYPLVLLAMLGIAMALLWYFFRKGWFR